MEKQMPKMYDQIAPCIDDIMSKIGKNVTLGLPIAVGKPTLVANEFYRRAKADPSMTLLIMSGLNLEKPKGKSELERRFLGPLVARLFPDYPDPEYMIDSAKNALPDNVSLRDFYVTPGGYLNNQYVQQGHISSNYTHVPRDVKNYGLNVAAVMVRRGMADGQEAYSLSSNADAPADMIAELLGERRKGAEGRKVAVLGQVNQNLPFMYGTAKVEPEAFTEIIDNPNFYHQLFGPPREPVTVTDYFVGVNTSPLILDDGCIQIGIGSLGDALSYGLMLRHSHNDTYKKLLKETGLLANHADTIAAAGGLEPFKYGLSVCTELVIDGFLRLMDAGIIKRNVYENLPLQRLLNQGRITEEVSIKTIEELLADGALSAKLTEADFNFLSEFGILRDGVSFSNGSIVTADGASIPADLSVGANLDAIAKNCLGSSLRNGLNVHGSFFLGPQSFYKALNDMTQEERNRIRMREISFTNQLYGDEELKRLQRKNARFVNVSLMTTILGAAVSDALDDGRVVSGVGGQYNFVCMAHEIANGRSVIILRSTRGAGEETISNVVFNYGHVTIPRHLKDIIVTEYGIADVRGRSDSDCVRAILNIADSRFQNDLLEKAKKSLKVRKDYKIPDQFRNNYPERLQAAIKPYIKEGMFQPFPFGTDFTPEEIKLGKALRGLKAVMEKKEFKLASIPSALKALTPPAASKIYLERMGLDKPKSPKETVMQKLVLFALANDGVI